MRRPSNDRWPEMGAGIRGTKLLLSPELLKGPPGVVVAELSEAG